MIADAVALLVKTDSIQREISFLFEKRKHYLNFHYIYHLKFLRLPSFTDILILTNVKQKDKNKGLS